MGSVDKDTSRSPINVLITGFEPFKKDYPVNPSWEIARSLPEWLPADRAKTAEASSARDPAESAPLPPVRLLVHPAPIRVNYQVVRRLVPRLWHLGAPDSHDDYHRDTQPLPPLVDTTATTTPTTTTSAARIDLAIHIGMAGPRLFYSIERRAHRDGYAIRDVDGELLGDEPRRAAEGPDWVWDGMPAELETDLDVEDVLRRWKGHSPSHVDLRISEDPGRYLCDFIYFSSLAHLRRAGRRRRVLFLHVPCDASERRVELGRELVLQLVRSAVESELARPGGFGDGGDGGEGRY